MNTINNNNVVGAFVKANKKVNGGKIITMYGMIDSVLCGGESYGLITFNKKDDSWTSCLIEPKETTFLTDQKEIELARACAIAYCKAEKESIDWKIKKLLGLKKEVEGLEKMALK